MLRVDKRVVAAASVEKTEWNGDLKDSVLGNITRFCCVVLYRETAVTDVELPKTINVQVIMSVVTFFILLVPRRFQT